MSENNSTSRLLAERIAQRKINAVLTIYGASEGAGGVWTVQVVNKYGETLLTDVTPAEMAAEAVVEAANMAASIRACRVCGCTDDRACPGGCWWVGPDLCSECQGQRERAAQGERPDPRTPDPRPAREGWRPLFPGVYEDRDGALHFAVPELLALFGFEDNAENRDLVEQEVRRVVSDLFPGSPVEVRE